MLNFASHQHVFLRDIPCLWGWVDNSASFGHNVTSSVVIARYYQMVKWTNVKKVTRLRESRSIDDVAFKNLLASRRSIEI